MPTKVYSFSSRSPHRKWPMSNLSNRDLSLPHSARRKTNNVIASDHVINVRRKVRTNSIICPQFSCTMHQNRKNCNILDETVRRTINNVSCCLCDKLSVDGTVLSKQKGTRSEEKDDHSNFTAWIVSLSSVSMQIFFSFRGGNMVNKVKHKILLKRTQNTLWEKKLHNVRRCRDCRNANCSKHLQRETTLKRKHFYFMCFFVSCWEKF